MGEILLPSSEVDCSNKDDKALIKELVTRQINAASHIDKNNKKLNILSIIKMCHDEFEFRYSSWKGLLSFIDGQIKFLETGIPYKIPENVPLDEDDENINEGE